MPVSIIHTLGYVFLFLVITLIVIIGTVLLVAYLSIFKFIVDYKFDKTQNNISIQVYIKSLNVINFFKDFNEKEKKTVKPKKKNKAKKMAKNYKVFFLKNLFELVSKKSALTIDNINTNVQLGVGEAHITAISSGVVYGILGSAYALLCNKFNVAKKYFYVKCYFNQFKLDIDFNCILRVKGVNIIKAIFKTFLFVVKK